MVRKKTKDRTSTIKRTLSSKQKWVLVILTSIILSGMVYANTVITSTQINTDKIYLSEGIESKNITLTPSAGKGINVYSTATDDHAAVIQYVKNNTLKNALLVKSYNINHTALQITGYTVNRGLVKISHIYPDTDDTGSAALSIELDGNNTKSLGIFVDTPVGTGTTGELLMLKNNNTEKFVVNYDGSVETNNDILTKGNDVFTSGGQVGYSSTQARLDFFTADVQLKNSNSFQPDAADSVNIGTTVQRWNIIYVNNVSMLSPNGTMWNCMVNNTGAFSCSE